MNSTLAIFGNLTIDDLVFADGTTRWNLAGGSAAYAAFGASLWTDRIDVVAPLGADYPHDPLLERFDLTRCSRISRTLRNWGLYEEDGSRCFVSRKSSRNWRDFCPKVEDACTGRQTAAHVGPLPHDLAFSLSRELRKNGTRIVSLDLDDHDLTGSPERESVMQLLHGVDVFLPSLQDAHALFPGATANEALRRLRAALPELLLIAVKCGKDGVIAHAARGRDSIHVPAISVEVVDATGAGDSFCGGVLAHLAHEEDPVEALICGAVSASFCLEGFGFDGLARATREYARLRQAELRSHVEFHPL